MFVVTIEYVDGQETKLVIRTWQEVLDWINPRLDAPHNARQVKRVTICPVAI